MTEEFSDIINLPHFVSSKRPQMSMMSRAAQFSSFAALSGYEDEVDEVARITDFFDDMTEDEQNNLNEAIQKLIERTSERPLVTVTYFKPDERKDGGEYVNYTGHFRILDMGDRKMKFTEGMEISLDTVVDVRILKDENIY